MEGTLEAEALRTNQDLGFERSWAKPEEGEAERAKPGDGGETGASESVGGTSAADWGAPLRRVMVEGERRRSLRSGFLKRGGGYYVQRQTRA